MNLNTCLANQSQPAVKPLTRCRLAAENRAYRGTGGVSKHNASRGFRPAFLDHVTGCLYLSCFADGRPAPFHLLDGLPTHLLSRSTETGQVTSTRPGVESGFVRDGRFFSRRQAAAALAGGHPGASA